VWLTVVLVALSPQQQHHRIRHHLATHGLAPAALVSREVFGGRWKSAVCIARQESRFTLRARNGVNLGPWQINATAHPWVNRWLLTHSWWYSARVAYRISAGGADWSAWTTHRLCGL
jgi:hypothetical protein